MNDSVDVKQVLKRAIDAVNDAGIPDELKPVALEKAIDLYAGAGTNLGGGGGGSGGGGGTSGGDGGGGGGGGGASAVSDDLTAIQKIAAKLKVDPETVGEVFDHDGDGLRIVLGASKFDAARRAGTKQIALLFAAGRQGMGAQEWTPVKDVREVVRDYNRFDSANFATTISQMDDVFLFKGNNAHSREVKVNRQGYEEAAALIKELTGSSGSS
jgi:hypothetical protein